MTNDVLERLPHKMDGRKWATLEELQVLMNDVFDYLAPVPTNRGVHFKNAGEIRCESTYGVDETVTIKVPLPYLDMANLTTDEVAIIARYMGPPGPDVEATIADPP